MLTSLFLSVQFFIGIGKRIANDTYFRSLAIVILILLLIGTLFPLLVGKWPFLESLLYAVTTMSMNTPYSGPLVAGAGTKMMVFHMLYTFLSVGSFIVFAIETGKTMMMTYEQTMKKMSERKAKKAAAKAKNVG